MTSGLTVPFSSLPTSWLNVSRPAEKSHSPFLTQMSPKGQSSTNKSLYGERGSRAIPTGLWQGEKEHPTESTPHL